MISYISFVVKIYTYKKKKSITDELIAQFLLLKVQTSLIYSPRFLAYLLIFRVPYKYNKETMEKFICHPCLKDK